MIIGISAKIGCGKTFLTNFFLEEYPEYIKLGFGDVLKQECSETYGYPLEWNYTEEGKVEIITLIGHHVDGMTVREILQWHGTEYRRAEDETYWLRKMIDILGFKNQFSGLFDKHTTINIVIDDVRFINEANFVKYYGGILIRINPYPEWKSGLYANHRSETELDNFEDWDLVLSPAFGKLKECVTIIKMAIGK